MSKPALQPRVCGMVLVYEEEPGVPAGLMEPNRCFPKLNPDLFSKPRQVRSLVSGNLLHLPGKRDRFGSANSNGRHTRISSLSGGGLFNASPQTARGRGGSTGAVTDISIRETIHSMWFWLNMIFVGELQALRGGGDWVVGSTGGEAVESRRQMALALEVLAKMKSEKLTVDEGVYRALIEASGRAGWHQQAVALLEEMQGCGGRPDAWVYGSLIKAVADSQACVTPQYSSNVSPSPMGHPKLEWPVPMESGVTGSPGVQGSPGEEQRDGKAWGAADTSGAGESVSKWREDEKTSCVPADLFVKGQDSSVLAVPEQYARQGDTQALRWRGNSCELLDVSHVSPSRSVAGGPPPPPGRRENLVSDKSASSSPVKRCDAGVSNGQRGSDSFQGSTCTNMQRFVARERRTVKLWPWEQEARLQLRACPSVVTWWPSTQAAQHVDAAIFQAPQGGPAGTAECERLREYGLAYMQCCIGGAAEGEAHSSGLLPPLPAARSGRGADQAVCRQGCQVLPSVVSWWHLSHPEPGPGTAAAWAARPRSRPMSTTNDQAVRQVLAASRAAGAGAHAEVAGVASAQGEGRCAGDYDALAGSCSSWSRLPQALCGVRCSDSPSVVTWWAVGGYVSSEAVLPAESATVRDMESCAPVTSLRETSLTMCGRDSGARIMRETGDPRKSRELRDDDDATAAARDSSSSSSSSRPCAFASTTVTLMAHPSMVTWWQLSSASSSSSSSRAPQGEPPASGRPGCSPARAWDAQGRAAARHFPSVVTWWSGDANVPSGLEGAGGRYGEVAIAEEASDHEGASRSLRGDGVGGVEEEHPCGGDHHRRRAPAAPPRRPPSLKASQRPQQPPPPPGKPCRPPPPPPRREAGAGSVLVNASTASVPLANGHGQVAGGVHRPSFSLDGCVK